MNSKFYVSLEAARLLKEKGYNEEVELYYNTLGELNEVRDMFCCEVADNTQMAKYDYLSAPTKADAIDWLESKRIVIDINCKSYGLMSTMWWEYCMIVFYIDDDNEIGRYESESFPTRLEAEEAAIIKALELL